MRFQDWAPEYARLLADFGFPPARDEEAARVLERELREVPGALRPTEARRRLGALLRGHPVLVLGDGPGPLPLPLPSPHLPLGSWRVLAADGATSACLRAGQVPDVIVTDLDGDLPDELRANLRGALVLVHAHGDNLPAVRRWTRRFPGAVVGTCAARPPAGLLNPGGFTDGDRAVYVAEEFGASRAVLAGFDFDEPHREPLATRERKRAKLHRAQELVEALARRRTLPLERWVAPGRTVPWTWRSAGPRAPTVSAR